MDSKPLNMTGGEIDVVARSVADRIVRALNEPGERQIILTLTAQKELFISERVQEGRTKKLLSLKERFKSLLGGN